jgi:predicted ATPase
MSSIRAENWKSFSDTGEIELAGINVLIGRNNSGKSAFLRAAHTVQLYGDPASEDLRIGNQSAVVSAVFTGEQIERDANRHFGNTFAAGLTRVNFITQTSIVNDGGMSNLQIGRSVKFTGIQGDGESAVGRIPASEPKNFIYTYFSKRKVSAFERTVDLDRTLAVQNDLRHLVAKVNRLANPDYEGAGEYEKLCKDVLGFRVSAYASQGGQQAGITVGRYDHIPLESMGEGVSSMLGLITDLCMGDGNLFLIEEPENDIHPESLKALLKVIVEKSKNNQFIITTHSNIVARYLGAAEDSKMFEVVMNQQADRMPTSKIREIENAPEARIEVLRGLGYELSDFDLWDGWLILEESSAEMIIRYLIPWFVPRLARIRTVAAGGVTKVLPTFEDFRRLFLFAHLEPQYRQRAWVIVDGDEPGLEVISQLQDGYGKVWPSEHFRTWSHGDFERYYPERFAEQVDAVLELPHDSKPKSKKRLTQAVKKWCDENPDEAKEEFAASAAEVIDLLREIDAKLFEAKD